MSIIRASEMIPIANPNRGQDMNRVFKVVLFASVCFALMLPLRSFADKGSGGGTTPPPVPTGPTLTASGTTVSVASGTVGVASDQPTILSLFAQSDGRDSPTITKLSGPAGLIIYNLSPVDHPHLGQNGYTTMAVVWTPTRSDIGQTAQAIFQATTQSGRSASITLNFAPVQDVPPAAVSGLLAFRVGDHIEAHWSPSATGEPLNYSLVACYMSVLVGSTIPEIYCDAVDKTAALQSLNIPAAPAINVGNPAVQATYYGLFLYAWSGVDGHSMGRVTTNIQ
jgi:hypothetical protein